MKARASMIKVKSDYKKGNETNPNCRLCKKDIETQKHILQNCPEMTKTIGKYDYETIFRDDVKTLRELADFIIKVDGKVQKSELPSMTELLHQERVTRLTWAYAQQQRPRAGPFYTVKPVCNDHLYNKIHHLWFIQ